LKNFCFCFAFIVILLGCKTPPVQFSDPSAALSFESIEAQNVSKIFINYDLSVKQPGIEYADFIIEEWNAIINDKEIKNGVKLIPDIPASKVRLEFDIPLLIEEGVPLEDDFTVDLTLNISMQGKDTSVKMQVKEKTVFPFIREPVFTITEIAILRDDLINTRFRVAIKIDNQNPFPVALSSLEYELYGNNLLWAEGRERNAINVPEKSSYQGNIFLTMNFINMRRDLLDQIIRLDDVNYRFRGKALVSTEVEYLPGFTTDFSLSGFSKVLDK